MTRPDSPPMSRPASASALAPSVPQMVPGCDEWMAPGTYEIVSVDEKLCLFRDLRPLRRSEAHKQLTANLMALVDQAMSAGLPPKSAKAALGKVYKSVNRKIREEQDARCHHR